jgi:DNA-binding MarR family transcriptional regulator
MADLKPLGPGSAKERIPALEFLRLLFHCRRVAMPVNRPPTAPSPPSGADARLYLRDQDLDQGAALIRAASRRLSQLVAPANDTGTEPPHLTDAERDILQELLDRGSSDVGELRRRLSLPKQSFARYLNQIEALGLVTRQSDARDRRRRLLALTPQGETFMRAATEQRRTALRQAFLTAGPDAVAGARAVLGAILKA